MKKRLYTESEVRQIVNNSVKRALKENMEDEYSWNQFKDDAKTAGKVVGYGAVGAAALGALGNHLADENDFEQEVENEYRMQDGWDRAHMEDGNAIGLWDESKKHNGQIKLSESEFMAVIKESVRQLVNEIGDTPKGQFMQGRLAARKMADYAQTKGEKRGMGYLGGDEWNDSTDNIPAYANKQAGKPDYAQPTQAFAHGFNLERNNEWDNANNTPFANYKDEVDKRYNFWKNSTNMR